MNLQQFINFCSERTTGQTIFDVPFLSSVAHNFDAVAVSNVSVNIISFGENVICKKFYEPLFFKNSVTFGRYLSDIILPDFYIHNIGAGASYLYEVYFELWCRYIDTDYSTLVRCPLTYLLHSDVPTHIDRA